MARRWNAVRPVSALNRLNPAPLLERGASASRRTLTVWAVVVSLLVLGTGVVWLLGHRHQAAEEARREALDSANKLVVETLSYNYRTADDDLKRASSHLTGSFRDEFTQLSQTLVLPSAKKNGISTRADIVSAGVISADADRVVTLLFVNQTTKSKSRSEAKVDGSRLRVTLHKVDDRWLIADLKPL